MTERTVSFSLRYKLLLYSIILILVPVLIIGSLAYRESVSAFRESILRSKLETMQLAQTTMDYIFRDVQNESLLLLQNKDLQSLLRAKNASDMKLRLLPALTQTNQNIWFLLGTKGYIDSVYIRGLNGVVFDPDATNYEISPGLESELRELRGMYVWCPDRVVSKYRLTDVHVLSHVRLMNDTEDITRSLGFLVINVSEAMISDIFADKGVTPGSRFYLVDRHGVIRSATDKGLLGSPLSALYGPLDPGGGTGRESYREWTVPSTVAESFLPGQRFVSISLPLESAGLVLVNITPAGELAGIRSGFQTVILVGITLSLVLSGLFAVFFSRRTLANVRTLSDALQVVGSGHFPVDLDLKGNDEIALLGTSVSTMSRTIANLIKENYEITLKEREAELMALEAQVAPHFLYNVLDTIYWKCRLEKAFKSAELLKALSDMFRLNLNRGDRFIPVSREIAYVKSYLLIQMEKYADRIQVDFDVEQGIGDVPVLKQVLQPIVENAIIHGCAVSDRNGRVQVKAFGTDRDVVFQVIDDGVGIDIRKVEQYLREDPRGRGIGLKNVDDRLRLNHGEAYRLVIERNPAGGTTVVIRQPRTGG